ncbi:hypothetical protein GCM10007049_35390 [Echinicola pacifica]|uniref:6-bladed beta-propeller protein n=1 Tax=Echinicola pacifica TaxID=346377 RepID=A0A918UWJ1_9BACT|nr:6-bladed beta-propeller [Echinicola pacifica]GGZ39005.1 hypothetical protein GCM10007049_35390 [Echinicola pacifica]
MKIVNINILLFFSLSIFFSSCGKAERSNSNNKFSNLEKSKILSQDLLNLDSDTLKSSYQMEIKVPDNNDNEVLMSEVIDSVWYLKLGEIPNDIISDWISEIEIHDERIYLMDGQKNEVYIFDFSGDFLFSKNVSGQGPGEFIRASSFAIDSYNNQLVIHDDRLSKVLYYTLDGEFIKEQRVYYRFLDFAYLNSSMSAVDLNKSDNNHLEEIRNNQLAIVDTTWKVIAKGGSYNATNEQDFYFTGKVFSKKGEEVFYLRPFSNIVYSFQQNKLTPYCYIDFGNQTLPHDTNFNFKMASDFAEEYSNYSYIVGNAYFLSDVTYFEHYYGGGRTAHLFRSNTTGKLFHGKINNDIYSLGFFQASTAIPEKNVLVSYTSSEQVYANRKMILESGTGGEALIDMVSNTESTDNPVLIFYKLKTDF